MTIHNDVLIARGNVSAAGEAADTVSASEAQQIIDTALAQGMDPDGIVAAFAAESDATGSLSRYSFLVPQRVAARDEAIEAARPSFIEQTAAAAAESSPVPVAAGIRGATIAGDTFGRRGMHTHGGAIRHYSSEAEARAAFSADRVRLLDVSQWGSLTPGGMAATFTLCDSDGHPVTRPAQVGDFVRIDATGDPSASDWVRVESVDSSDDRVSVVVRPTYDPTATPLRTDITMHMFTSAATNTFTIARDGADVLMSVDGRNEFANTGAEALSPLYALRNRAGAEALWGSETLGVGGSSMMWNTFSDSLLGGS